MRILFIIVTVISILLTLLWTLDEVFVTTGIFDLAEQYYVSIPYYIFVGFSFWGSLGLLFALVFRKQWGYPLALGLIWASIIFTTAFFAAGFFDETFMFKYMLTITPPADRDIDLLAEMYGTPVSRYPSVAGFIVSGAAYYFYLRLTRRNKDYFCY